MIVWTLGPGGVQPPTAQWVGRQSQTEVTSRQPTVLYSVKFRPFQGTIHSRTDVYTLRRRSISDRGTVYKIMQSRIHRRQYFKTAVTAHTNSQVKSEMASSAPLRIIIVSITICAAYSFSAGPDISNVAAPGKRVPSTVMRRQQLVRKQERWERGAFYGNTTRFDSQCISELLSRLTSHFVCKGVRL